VSVDVLVALPVGAQAQVDDVTLTRA